MCKITLLLAVAITALLVAGCAGPERKLGRGLSNSYEIVRWGETRNLLLAGRLVTEAALRRTESRGAHYRADFPEPAEPAQPRQFLTIADLPPYL